MSKSQPTLVRYYPHRPSVERWLCERMFSELGDLLEARENEDEASAYLLFNAARPGWRFKKPWAKQAVKCNACDRPCRIDQSPTSISELLNGDNAWDSVVVWIGLETHTPIEIINNCSYYTSLIIIRFLEKRTINSKKLQSQSPIRLFRFDQSKHR
jgi:uncharacterized protein YlaI